MNVTVILCTYNRSQSVIRALESVGASEMPESIAWEVLVMDNNSKDDTRQAVEEFCRRDPERFHYGFEGRQGKSYALNTAIREARGSILAFMDDDVVVAPTWLHNLTAPLATGTWAGAGGRILPANSFECPGWLALDGRYSLGGVLAMFDLGNHPEELKSPPYGANMAFRKSIFQEYGGFRTDLGPCPGSEIRNEDTEFGRRLFNAGEHLWYVPSAVVYHAVPENRLAKRYFLRFYYDLGRSQIREHANRASVYGIPRWCFSVPRILLTILPKRMAGWFFSRDPKERFFYKCTVWTTYGEIVELPKIWLDRRKNKGSNPKRNERLEQPGVSPEV